MKKVLLAASSGGHWVQLRRIESAVQHLEVHYASTDELLASDVPRFHELADGSFGHWIDLGRCAFSAARVVLKIRPDYVISTGAAPGFFAILFGRILGARTVWIDSIANAERFSMSGRLAKPFSHLWISQWEHVAKNHGAKYFGSVI